MQWTTKLDANTDELHGSLRVRSLLEKRDVYKKVKTFLSEVALLFSHIKGKHVCPIRLCPQSRPEGPNSKYIIQDTLSWHAMSACLSFLIYQITKRGEQDQGEDTTLIG